MNDNLISSEIAAALTTFPESVPSNQLPLHEFFTLVPNIAHAQSGCTTARPLLTISGKWREYGPRRLGVLSLELRSRSGDQDGTAENAHLAAVEKLSVALLGEAAATFADTLANRAARVAVLKAKVLAQEKVEITFYAPHEDFLDSDFDGEDYVTTMRLNMGWRFLPPA